MKAGHEMAFSLRWGKHAASSRSKQGAVETVLKNQALILF